MSTTQLIQLAINRDAIRDNTVDAIGHEKKTGYANPQTNSAQTGITVGIACNDPLYVNVRIIMKL